MFHCVFAVVALCVAQSGRRVDAQYGVTGDDVDVPSLHLVGPGPGVVFEEMFDLGGRGLFLEHGEVVLVGVAIGGALVCQKTVDGVVGPGDVVGDVGGDEFEVGGEDAGAGAVSAACSSSRNGSIIIEKKRFLSGIGGSSVDVKVVADEEKEEGEKKKREDVHKNKKSNLFVYFFFRI